MYQKGSTVVYGSHGVCKVIGTEKRRVDKKNVEYLVLEPVDSASCHCFVPMMNDAAMAKIRPLLTRDQLDELLSPEALRKDVWIEEEDQRKARYKELISGSDISALIAMIHFLHRHKKQLQEVGKKFHQSDENFLRDAQKLLETEFSLVLELSGEEIGAYIQKIFA